jgi:hypothetical protein
MNSALSTPPHSMVYPVLYSYSSLSCVLSLAPVVTAAALSPILLLPHGGHVAMLVVFALQVGSPNRERLEKRLMDSVGRATGCRKP